MHLIDDIFYYTGLNINRKIYRATNRQELAMSFPLRTF